MAQKTIAPKTTQAGLADSGKNAPIVDGVVTAEVVVNIPRPTNQQYPEVNAAIDRGLADVAAGRVRTRRSYAEYADIEITE